MTPDRRASQRRQASRGEPISANIDGGENPLRSEALARVQGHFMQHQGAALHAESAYRVTQWRWPRDQAFSGGFVLHLNSGIRRQRHCNVGRSSPAEASLSTDHACLTLANVATVLRQEFTG